MDRHELQELHYITPIENLPSIMQLGILSNRRSKRLNAATIALQEVQDKRAQKRVPGGLALHDYANLYICGRNPMLYKRLSQRHNICVLALAPDLIDIEGVVVTDQNAASDYVRFSAGAAGLAIVDRERTFAEYWTDPDPVEQWRRKAAKCAEALVPHRVDPAFIRGAYVCSAPPRRKIEELGIGIAVSENRGLFFNSV
jgi:hypothetical protein